MGETAPQTHSKVNEANLCNSNTQAGVHINRSARSDHLTRATVHRAEVLRELLSDGKVHVEVSQGGDGADRHGIRVEVVVDVFGGLQEAHDRP